MLFMMASTFVMVLSVMALPGLYLRYQKTSMKKIYMRRLMFVCAASLIFQLCGVNARGQQQNQDTAQPEQ